MASPVAAVRWGLIGTANIAAHAFLPALRAAGGTAVAVGSRDAARAASWAASHGVGRAVSYQEVIDAEDVDAVYVAVPNDQHDAWAAAAAAAGKAVLCEKPMTLDAQRTAALVATAGPEALLWEAFAFPFHPQTATILDAVSSGRMGTVREVVSEFHFAVGQPDNIRLQRALGGGALYDVGCYPIRLARLVLDSEPVAAVGAALSGGTEVDLDVAGVVDFPADARLVMSAGMRRPASTATRIIGTLAELRISNPFHPAPGDSIELWAEGTCQERWVPNPQRAFQFMIEHVAGCAAGVDEPRHSAHGDAVPQARALDLVRGSVERRLS